MSQAFAAGAVRLAGQVPRLLGWSPAQFWDTTPAELAAVLAPAGHGEPAPLSRSELAALMERDAMDDEIETLLVDVRASTAGFRSDIDAMRGALDTSLVDGFAKAGSVLEQGLLSAIRRGSLGFDDLKRVALQTLGEIASHAVRAEIGSLVGTSQQGGGQIGSILNGAIGALFGLPGRATGGPVAPGAAYLVGERGPEVFVPTSAGRVEAPGRREARDVRVSIQLAQPKGSDAPTALRRSSRQIASSVRRALREF